jgi:hypothetical protein
MILNAPAFRAAACQRRSLAAEGRLVKYVDRSIIHGHILREEVGFVSGGSGPRRGDTWSSLHWHILDHADSGMMGMLILEP